MVLLGTSQLSCANILATNNTKYYSMPQLIVLLSTEREDGILKKGAVVAEQGQQNTRILCRAQYL
jgi:hypothetical protein